MSYTLQPLLRIRMMREDRATGELTAARLALAAAEEALAARQRDFAEWEETKEERRDRIYDAIIGHKVSMEQLDIANEGVARIDEEGVLKADNVKRAEGVVKGISIFYTKLTTLDNRLVLIPNGDLMSSNVTNLSAEKIRRIDLDFKITNDIDQDLVRSVLMAAAKATNGVLEDPAPFARLTAVDDDTYIFTVRAWCDTASYWDVYFDLIENCSSALAANGIDDPEERIAVRLVKDEDDNEKAAE